MTVNAGDDISAADINAVDGSGAKSVQPGAGASNATTSFTALATISSFTFKAGMAYEAWWGGNLGCTIAGNRIHLRLYKASTAGTDYGEYGRYWFAAATSSITTAERKEGSLVLRRSAGTDLTTDLVLAWAPSSIAGGNTANMYTASGYPFIFLVRPIGPNSAYSGVGIDVS